MTLSELVNKPHRYYAPTFVIEVQGQNMPKRDLLKEKIEIFSVTVNRTIEGASDFSITINNPPSFNSGGKRDFPLLSSDLLKLDADVEIKMGYGDRSPQLKTVFFGFITAIDVSFPSNGVSQLTVKGYDRLHLLMKGKKKENWGSDRNPVKYSDIVRRICGTRAYGLTTSLITDTGERHRQIKQDNQSDYEFVKQKLADEISFEFFVDIIDNQPNQVVFRPRSNTDRDVAATLKWGVNLVSFSPQINTAEQVSEVQLRGWDPNNQRAIVATARQGSEHGRDGGDRTASQTIASTQGEVIRKIWQPVSTQREADQLAQSILESTALKFVTGSGESLGLPEIEAGKNVELKGLGGIYSKTYYVEKVTHTINTSGYKTTFNVKENSI